MQITVLGEVHLPPLSINARAALPRLLINGMWSNLSQIGVILVVTVVPIIHFDRAGTAITSFPIEVVKDSTATGGHLLNSHIDPQFFVDLQHVATVLLILRAHS